MNVSQFPNPEAAGPFDLSGRTAVVTGASRGLGHAAALALARAGANVVLAARDQDALEQRRVEIESFGGSALIVALDVSSRASVDDMVLRSVHRYGRIDILVNNAGIVLVKPFLDLTDEDFVGVLDTNLLGAFRCAQAVGRLMVGQGSGKVVNISSVAGIRGRALEVAYSASKGAVNMLTLSLAVEWARHNVNVNAICPGYFLTSLNERELLDQELRQTIERRIPMRRIALPAELGPTVVFLASPASDYITGQILALDGGTTSR